MLTPSSSTDLLVIVSYGSHPQDAPATAALAQALSAHLGIPVRPAFLEAAGESVGESIQAGVTEHHPDRVIVLPMFLGASAAKHNNVRLIVDAAKDRWPEIGIVYGEPPGTHPGVIQAYRRLLSATAETALLVVGRGNREPATQAKVQEMVHLIGQSEPFITVESAFYSSAQPDIPTGIERCVRAGARRVIVLPYLLYETSGYEHVVQQVQRYQAAEPVVELITAPALAPDAGILDALRQRYHEALVTLAGQLSGTGTDPYRLPHSHSGVTHIHPVPPAFLPPRYQDSAPVSAAPMGAADLVFGDDGQVAWDQIWGSFCDLALAGGPPHRGTLLEPVTPEMATANPDRYQWVVNELARGIGLVTHLPLVPQQTPGWIGIQCTDEAMALWLMRAIIVENVSVRREESVLYLPAGPDFRLEHEIKNVITVIAKTHHYWTEHLNG